MNDRQVYYPDHGWQWKWVIVAMMLLGWALVAFLGGCTTAIDKVASDGPTALAVALDERFYKMEDLPNNVFIFVYDPKTKLWNRARVEALASAKCEHLRAFVMVATEEGE